MTKSLELLIELINEDKVTTQEVLEACGYKVDVVYTDVYENDDRGRVRGAVKLIGYDEKIIAFKEVR